jgi:hypothetical protein
MACSSLAVGEARLAQRLTLQAAITRISMELQEVKKTLQLLMTELRCELTGWDKSIPVEALKGWIKKVDTRIIKRIE